MDKHAQLSPRQAAAAKTRATILAAAVECFTELSYDAMTIRLLCDRAGISTGAFFSHWPGKADLYEEIFGHQPLTPEEGRELLEAMWAISAGEPLNVETYAAGILDGMDLKAP